MKAIRVYQPGNPDVMCVEETPLPMLKESDILLENKVSGINGKDLLFRNGTYAGTFPYTPGIEGSGIVIDKGNCVTNFQIGDRVAYCHGGTGSYAQYTAVPAQKAVLLPETIDYQVGGACLVQGIAAHYLTHSTFPLQRNHTVLIHAAAGGLGLLLVQMAKLQGAKVIGTVSTPKKAKIAEDAGADHTILYSQSDFEVETMELTKGVGVDVVYDSVGAATFEKSLKSLKSRGLLVLLGQSSGLVSPFDLSQLSNPSGDRGSFYLTRPTTKHYIQGAEFQNRINSLFDYILTGNLKVFIGQQYPLEKASKAHEDLSNRQTVGKSLLIF